MSASIAAGVASDGVAVAPAAPARSRPAGTTTIRGDIQALRGLAIILVLLYHAHIGVDAGFLGVDVFFVVSGFLITTLVKQSIEGNRFSFAGFYFRRAKRLLPAAYVTFFVVAVLSLLFLAQPETKDFAIQLLGAITFSGNIALWHQGGYFGSAADYKPLLHVWSLAIEEQYYLFLPATLLFIPRRFWLLGASTVTALSALTCLAWGPTDPAASFYLLPTRAWELGVGSIGALSVAVAARHARLWGALYWPSLVVLLAIPLHPLGGSHPGWDAVLVCFATLVVILRRNESISATWPSKGLAQVGEVSYSLYLVHWPIIAFINNVWIGEMPRSVRILGVALSLPLAYALFRFVEKPVREGVGDRSPRFVAVALATSAFLVLVSLGLFRYSHSNAEVASRRRINYGLSDACEFETDFTPKQECRTSGHPRILVWGDSFAMALVPGLVDTDQSLGIVQATKSSCGPLLGVAPVSRDMSENYNPRWARRCMQFNETVSQYLSREPSIEVVVLSSPFDQYLDSKKWILLDAASSYVDPGVDFAVAQLRATVARIRGLNKRVVVVAPPPSAGFDVGGCLERRSTGLWRAGPNADCEIPDELYRQKRAASLKLLARLPLEANVDVVGFDDYLCANGVCHTSIDNHWVFRDGGHLSHEGSVLLAKNTRLVERLIAHAR